MVWTRAKINYAFVFEYDTRHTLDWRQLTEVRVLFGKDDQQLIEFRSPLFSLCF
jgi:hypothetical protein